MPTEKYTARADNVHSLLCVGLDPDFDKLPERFRQEAFPQFAFNKSIIDAAHAYTSAFKSNIAFYEARGDRGIRELKMTMAYLQERYSDVFTICDAKRADIGNTNRGYVTELFDWLGFDAVTLHPYLGREALQPFLERRDKGCIILCRTSNSGAGELQDLVTDGKPLWQIVAEKVRDEWNKNSNCMLVVGATYPNEMRKLRHIMDDMPFLVPGIGAQGGNLAEAVSAGLDSKRGGLIIAASRSIIFSLDPAKEAGMLRDEINRIRSI